MTYSSPFVSVVIPCSNAECWVAEAIQSCLNQAYSPLEVVVIDDGSTDRSLEIIKSFGDKIRWETGPICIDINNFVRNITRVNPQRGMLGHPRPN